MTGSEHGGTHGDPLGPITRGPLATFIVLGVAVAIVVAGGYGLLASRTPASSGSPAQASPTASGEVAAEDWAAVGVLPPLEPIASLVPATADRTGVAADTAFILVSLDGRPASELAAGLEVEPAVELRVAPGSSSGSVTVTPAELLQSGQRYRFRLRTADEALAGSWAFTVKQPLHVVSTLPDDQSTEVPLDTGIELTFDQDGAIDVDRHFALDPPTEGRFETHGRTVVFVPEALEPDTLYTVSLSAGVGVEGSDVRLEQDVRVRFETATAQGPQAEPRIVLGRTVIEAASDEPPVVAFSIQSFEDEDGEEAPPPDRLPVEVYRLEDTAAALEVARTLADTPYWANTSAGLVATDGLTRVLSAELPLTQADWDAHAIVLPEPLPRGAYLLVIPREGRDAQGLVQVTDLASYSLVSATRSLFWVNRIEAGPVAGVRVAIDGGAALGRTGEDGLLMVDTPRALLRADDATVLVTLTAPTGETAIVPLGLTARIGAYPSDIHAVVDDELLEVLRADTPDDRSPAFALAARRNGDSAPIGGGVPPLARSAHIDRETDAILADTSGGYGYGEISDQRYWSILSTDRSQYRQTDTIRLWGYLRDRDTLSVPADAEVKLFLADDDEYGAPEAPALATRTVVPGPSGAFQAAFDLRAVPLGGYRVQLQVGGKAVATQYVSVTVIRKPAYKLEMELRRHVLLVGDRIRVSIAAHFYEGTVAPGVTVNVGIDEDQAEATTDAGGQATAVLTATYPEWEEDFHLSGVYATVAGAEEGEIETSAWTLVFPSDRWLTATTNLDGRRLRLRGAVNEVDVGRLERESASIQPGYDLDPKGDPIAGARVTIELIRLVPIRTLVGQHYDFIAKKVVPEYEVETRERSIASRTVESGDDGGFSLRLAVPNASDEYKVVMRTTDGEGRVATKTVYAAGRGRPFEDVPVAYLEVTGLLEGADIAWGLGETVQMTLREGQATYPSRADGFLFVTAQRGLRGARVQDSARFRHAFEASDAPNVMILGVAFSGRTFVAAGRSARFDTGERQLTVRLETDKPLYRPGDQATFTARTTTRDGKPVAATVTLRGIDEKLFTIGAVEEEDPLGQLYTGVGDGLYRSYTSHPMPRFQYGDGGGDTGGGGRDDFRDTLVFDQFETGPDGVGTVTLKLADDLTSWHLSASAVTAGLEAGVGTTLVPVGLPFFVEPTLAPEFVLADRPILRLRAFGSDLESGDRVSFTVSSETLDMAPVTVEARAFEPVDVPLPNLRLGEHRLDITGSAGGGLTDRLVRTFDVIGSRATKTEISYAALDVASGVESGPGLTTVTVSDAGRGRYLAVLEGLAWSDGARLDRALSAVVARDLLATAFGRDVSAYPDPSFAAAAYQRDGEGLALLPYSSASHDLTVRAILAAPDRFGVPGLRSAMRTILDDSLASRERRLQALAGSAVLGAEVLGEVRAAAALDDLSVREQLYLALAAAALGDDATAIELERGLVAQRGERRGPWLRIVEAGSSDESVEATSLLALVMVEVGDPLADEAEAYVEANPMRDDLSALQQLAFIQRALDRTPRVASRFAYTVDGARTEVTLAPGATRTLTLTEPQARSLRLEPLSGEVGVTVSRQMPLEPSVVTVDPALVLTRTVSPAGPVPAGRPVTVDLTLRFGSQALTGCTDVVDEVPSGLAPLIELSSWPELEDEDGAVSDDVITPYAVAGQRVAFCAAPDPRHSVVTMRYHARVVSPGVYTWEPATAQSAIASDQTSLTPAGAIDLR